jgi:hypothetical protein
MDHQRHISQGVDLSFTVAVWTLVSLFLLHDVFLCPPYCLAQENSRFTYRITDFQPLSTTYGRIKGLVTNHTDKDFREAIFKLVVYNTQGMLLGQAKFSLRNLVRGKTKEFTTTLKAKNRSIDHYRIDFVSGTTFERAG